jgi:hypothetical protein
MLSNPDGLPDPAEVSSEIETLLEQRYGNTTVAEWRSILSRGKERVRELVETLHAEMARAECRPAAVNPISLSGPDIHGLSGSKSALLRQSSIHGSMPCPTSDNAWHVDHAGHASRVRAQGRWAGLRAAWGAAWAMGAVPYTSQSRRRRRLSSRGSICGEFGEGSSDASWLIQSPSRPLERAEGAPAFRDTAVPSSAFSPAVDGFDLPRPEETEIEGENLDRRGLRVRPRTPPPEDGEGGISTFPGGADANRSDDAFAGLVGRGASSDNLWACEDARLTAAVVPSFSGAAIAALAAGRLRGAIDGPPPPGQPPPRRRRSSVGGSTRGARSDDLWGASRSGDTLGPYL